MHVTSFFFFSSSRFFILNEKKKDFFVLEKIALNADLKVSPSASHENFFYHSKFILFGSANELVKKYQSIVKSEYQNFIKQIKKKINGRGPLPRTHGSIDIPDFVADTHTIN